MPEVFSEVTVILDHTESGDEIIQIVDVKEGQIGRIMISMVARNFVFLDQREPEELDAETPTLGDA